MVIESWNLQKRSSVSGEGCSTALQKTTFEPCHEKINILYMQKQRRRSALIYSNLKDDQRLCFRYMDSTIPLACTAWFVGPVRKPGFWFSHDAIHKILYCISLNYRTITLKYFQKWHMFINRVS